ncbi:hypothetical protein ACFSO9_08960 [Mesonia maritima]
MELQHWLTKLEENHHELDYLQLIHKKIIQDSETAYGLQQVRRINTLVFASFCKYEQELKKNLEYSHEMYDFKRHEKKRVEYINSDKHFYDFKIRFYKKLSKYNIR